MKTIIRASIIMILSGVCAVNETCGEALPSASVIAVQGSRLTVNGSAFTVKGVCYSPIKAGYTWSNYDWWSDPSAYNTDFPLIKAMGANCIRTYGASSNDTYVQNVLDAAAAAGIYVILGYNASWTTDFSVAGNRTAAVNDFIVFVNKWKGHRALLAWSFGNEVDAHTPNAAGWFACLNEAAVAAHAAEGAGYHPVMTANQEIDETVAYDAVLASLDMWGINAYRGKSFTNMFTVYSSTKPFIMTEWGSDAFDGRVGNESETMQSDCLEYQWGEIAAHLSSGSPADECAGGCVFAWSDEWWKGVSTPGDPGTMGNGGDKGCSVQDIVCDWTNGAYEDTNMNEEWWGMVRISLNSYDRSPRKGYYSLSALWGGVAADETEITAPEKGILKGEVRNFPNPLVADGSNSTRIKFLVNGTPELKVEIFDLSGEKVRELAGINKSGSLRELYWDGRDSDRRIVPSGLYICRIKAELSGMEETKYRKIAVIK